MGAQLNEAGIWKVGEHNFPLLPRQSYLPIAHLEHSQGHFETTALAQTVLKSWGARGLYIAAKGITSACPTCQAFNNDHKASLKAQGRKP